MAEKIVSPGVFTKEIDASFLPAAIGAIGAVVIGPTVKGPALIPTQVTSYSEFQTLFGDTFASGGRNYQYLTSHTAEQYLRNNNLLTVVRVLAGSYGGASATISSSIDPAIVGGGTRASGSITFNSVPVTASSNEMSISLGGMDFVFTSSGWDPAINPNVADTKIFVIPGSGSGDSAIALRDVINNSGSTHNLELSASVTSTASSTVHGPAAVDLTFNHPGSFGVPKPPTFTGDKGIFHGGSPSGSGWSRLRNIITSSVTMSAEGLQGGRDFTGDPNNLQPNETYKEVFKLHTLADGEIMNSVGPVGTKNILESGSKDNLRYEISSLNISRGSFTLTIRRGDDIENRKSIIETYNNVNLDPNSPNYIAKSIGDQYHTISTDENGDPFLQLVGDYPRKSKYVRVEVLQQTPDYIDENGGIRDGALSSSLPHFSGSAFSGSLGGAFSGGSDGTVTHPRLLYHNIEENNSQGLDISDDGGSSGFDDYIKVLNLLKNQDDYDINLILIPGVIDRIHTAVASKAIDICEDRGDCFAIIDPVEYGKNVADAKARAEARSSNYGAVYWPWVKINDSRVTGAQRWVPPSVVVSGVYAFNDRVSHEWFAPAGLNRGGITTAIQAERKLTQADRDTLYDANVNPIATFPGQGVTVFGQKTLQKKASALDRINVRRLLIRVKKFIASSSRFLVFEQNTAQTRRRFLAMAQPFLQTIQSQSGLNAFRIIMDETNNTPDAIDRNQLVGQVFLQPTRTAEFIVLDFTVQPTGASFPE